MGLSALLFLLVAFLLLPLILPSVPPVQFLVVSERSFVSDKTHLTQLPPGSTAVNASRLLDVAERLHEYEPLQVGKPVKPSSIAELIQSASGSEDKSLIIYLTAEASFLLTDSNDMKVGVQFLSADPAKDPVPLANLLSTLSKRKSMRTLLILELTGRNPGLASGVLADDFRERIENELRAENIPGLTVIGAFGKDERSWEYFKDAPVAVTNDSGADAPKAAAADFIFPEFDGTVFGHFLFRAFEEGKAENASSIHAFLNRQVQDWVKSHYGCTQTVWIVSGSKDAEYSKLITGIKLPQAAQKLGDKVATVVTSESESEKSKGDDSKTDGIAGTSKAGSEASLIDDRPVALMKPLIAVRDRLIDGPAPVRFPAEWLRLQVNMMAAERFAMNGNEAEFRKIHDEVLKKILNRLDNPKNAATSEQRRLIEIEEWLTLSNDGEVALGQLRQMLTELKDTGKLTALPKELLSPGAARRAFAIELIRELENSALGIDAISESDRGKEIQPLAKLVEGLDNKWSLKEFPESMATVKNVLQGSEQDPNALRLKPLVRLLKLRQNALQLAAGYGSDKRLLRQATWKKADVAERLDEILIDLNSAERWLCIGPDAVRLAEDRLDEAEKAMNSLLSKVTEHEGLLQVQDAQTTELPFLIEYLALLQESNSLPDTELKAAGRMAESAQAGHMQLNEFPPGQLGPIGFDRDHLAALLALTRDFSAGDQVSQSDKEHLNRLRKFVSDRVHQAVSATERLQLLNIPQFTDRPQLLKSLQMEPAGGNVVTEEKSSHSGIWLSFWSLRLVQAVLGQPQKADWTKWSTLVTAIDEGKTSDIPRLRAEMASDLQLRWKDAVGELSSGSDTEIFVSEKEILDLLSTEVLRRTQTSANPNLFSSISQTVGADVLNRSTTSLVVLSPEATPSPDGSFDVPLKVQSVSRLYVLDDSFTLLNPEMKSHHQWSFLPVSTTEGAEPTEVILKLKTNRILSSPTPITLIAVNQQGAAVVSEQVTVQPSSDNEWEIEVVQVEEGKTTERSITLPDGKIRSERFLPLLPSTWDDEKKAHSFVLLKIRLKRVTGVANKIRVQLRPVDQQKAAWANVELTFPEGESQVIVPLTPLSNAAPGAPAVVPSAAAATTEIDISDGIVFEVTPLDLPQQVTTSLTLYPRLHAPEHIFEIPEPEYNHDTSVLTVRLDRRAFDNSTVIWPTQFPGKISLNPSLRMYFKSGSLITPTADAFTFELQFQPEIEKRFANSNFEFGISLAGIPHAWWWQLTDGPKPNTVKGVRSFLAVENDKEVIPVTEVPALLLGKDWRTAKLRSTVFLHEVPFDREQTLFLNVNSTGSNVSTPARDRPFQVKGRFMEIVKAAAGESGIWKISTLTEPYGIPSFEPSPLGLTNGNYKLLARLETFDRTREPIESAVPFTLDDSPPLLTGNDIELKSSSTLVTGTMMGQITVRDPESMVTRIRVGLKEDLMQELKFTPDGNVVEDFELDASQGFPKLEQKETKTEDYGTLIVEVFNAAGIPNKQTKQIKFHLPGKAVAMKAEPKPPGSIKVTFSSSAEFTVTVSGPDGYMDEKTGPSPVVLDNVPVGKCSVKWKPKLGTAGSGANPAVVVRSGKTTPVSGN